MRVLLPPQEGPVVSGLREARIEVQELPALGWEALLELAITTQSKRFQALFVAVYVVLAALLNG